jgi:hypothetical protein
MALSGEVRRMGLETSADVCKCLHSAFFLLLFYIYTLLNDLFLLDYVYEWTNGYLHYPDNEQRRRRGDSRRVPGVFLQPRVNSPHHLNNDDGWRWAERFNVWGGWRHRRLQPPQYVFFFPFFPLLNDLFLLDYVYEWTNGYLHYPDDNNNDDGWRWAERFDVWGWRPLRPHSTFFFSFCFLLY